MVILSWADEVLFYLLNYIKIILDWLFYLYSVKLRRREEEQNNYKVWSILPSLGCDWYGLKTHKRPKKVLCDLLLPRLVPLEFFRGPIIESPDFSNVGITICDCSKTLSEEFCAIRFSLLCRKSESKLYT